MPMNLQCFAENPDGGNGTSPAEQTTPPDNKQKDEETGKTFSRDEVAKMIAAETTKAVKAAEKRWRKEKDEADKLATMDEKEKADYEKQKLEDELAEYKRKDVLLKMSEQASEMLSDKGANPTKEMLKLIVTEDAETTADNVKTYLASIDAEREAIKADFEKRLGGRIPLDGTTNSSVQGEFGKQLAQRTATKQHKHTYFKN